MAMRRSETDSRWHQTCALEPSPVRLAGQPRLVRGSGFNSRRDRFLGGFVMAVLDVCPFCGDDSGVIYPNALASRGCEMGIPGLDTFYGHCDECGAEGPCADSEWEAIEVWNRRG